MKGVVFLGVLLPLLACAAQQQPSSERKASVDVKGETTAASGSSAAACPCLAARLCEPVSAGPRKEVLGFVTSQLNWARYNWSEVTTLAMFTGYNSSLMCYAHSMDVRVVVSANYEVADLSNATKRSVWVQHLLQEVQTQYLDGVNIDIEESVKDGSPEQKLLVQLVEETYTAFKKANPHYQVTFDVAWSPDCIDGRCYDAPGLARWTDFLVVMSYDERSQIYGPCIASANSAYNTTATGILKYVGLGIKQEQLVLGLPWYGYDYPCTSLSVDSICSIPKVPYHSVDCSDAAGKQLPYAIVSKMVNESISGRVWNETLESPFFNYKDAASGAFHQVWYDDPQSLKLKYLFARVEGLRGLAFWNVDQLDYGDSPEAKSLTAEMWRAISAFLKQG